MCVSVSEKRYVDDIVVIEKNQNIVDNVLKLIKQKFDIKVLGKTGKLLGVEFLENNGNLYIH